MACEKSTRPRTILSRLNCCQDRAMFISSVKHPTDLRNTAQPASPIKPQKEPVASEHQRTTLPFGRNTRWRTISELLI
ncbi:hypothetical protein A0H81_00174 [Grifola frondosa]|uniref:Uncharacterized protein n=1 Tax=Grifola frondosa TaxID=5627 RepID=A0A1C7MS78_GRIFR|nr:hypothetical protein A0H81_00174 [Grifola frondosa]